MALNNLFSETATESTASSVDRSTGQLSRAPQTPKTTNYLDRVIVDNTVGIYNYRTYLWDTGNYTTWWNPIAAVTMDQRQTFTEQVRTNAIAVRNRWSY